MIKLAATIYYDDTTLINVDEKNLLSFKCSFMSVSDISKPSYGIISNEGTLDLIDTDGEIFRLYKERNSSLRNSNIKIYISNDLTNSNENIGTFYVRDFDYDKDDRNAIITFGDDLIEWQEINIDVHSKRLKPPGTAHDIYNFLSSLTPKKFNFASLDEKTKDFLKKYNVPITYYINGTLWDFWDKLCQACALHIYKNKSSEIVVKHKY